MNAIDCNCLCGTWPFRYLRESGIGAIAAKHRETGIATGLIANMNSIFYNDPFEGEQALHSMLTDHAGRHVMTVNPMLPGFEDDIGTALMNYNICAVRIYPGIHGYPLCDNGKVDRLCAMLGENGLPLFISARMEDERLNYIHTPLTPDEFGLNDFVRRPAACRRLLLTVRWSELLAMKDALPPGGSVWYDTSGLKTATFGIAALRDELTDRRLVFGSLYPLQSLRSTLYLVTRDDLGEETVENIMSRNARELLGETI